MLLRLAVLIRVSKRSAIAGSRDAKAQQHQTEQTHPPTPRRRLQTPLPAVPFPQARQRDSADARRGTCKDPRVTIDTAALSGSINLAGARLDDLKLKATARPSTRRADHHPLQPGRDQGRLFTELGYIGGDNSGATPGQRRWESCKRRQTDRKNAGHAELYQRQGHHVQPHDLGRRTLHVHHRRQDQQWRPTAGLAFELWRVIRYNKPLVAPTYVLHEGFIASSARTAYSKANMRQSRRKTSNRKGDGWLARHYRQVLAATMVPPQTTAYNARFSHFTDGQPRFQADYKQDAVTVAPPIRRPEEPRLCRRKEVPVIDQYEQSYSIPRFDRLIDWGWFYFITKPMFKLMDFFYRFFGNFGVAILCTTIVVKTLFFPLASKQYASMANMKRMQPKMEELKASSATTRWGCSSNDAALQGREDQPCRRLLADRAADPDLLLAL